MFFHNRNVLLNHVCSIPVCVCPFCPQCLCSAAVHRGSDYIRECGHCWVMQQVPCASRSSPISTTLHGHVCSYKHIYIYLHASTCVCIHAQMHRVHMEFITDVVISLKETFYCYPYQVIYTYVGLHISTWQWLHPCRTFGKYETKDQNHKCNAVCSWKDRRPYSKEREGDIMYTSCLLKVGRRSTSIRKSSLKKRKPTMEKR